jgi:predicted nucleic-acid-binding protein
MGTFMIAFDTNLLVRYLTEDDKAQCEKVENLIKSHSGEEVIFLSNIVLVETEWVLHSVYGFSPKEIHHALDTIVSIGQFAFKDRELIKHALQKYHDGIHDFSDCLIGEDGKNMHAKTYTFDKQLSKDNNFIVV